MTEPVVAQSGPSLAARPLAWLRSRFRSSEGWYILLSIGVGAAAGLLTVLLGQTAHLLQAALFGFEPGGRLSSQIAVPPLRLLWLPIGGLALGLVSWWLSRRRTGPLVDVVEANALYGGRMSIRDSIVVCIQTLMSNGFGASVGLEAAYAQAGGGFASALGQRLRLRRQDLRTLVGAGAGAAIGAAFGAPLAGAFYAIEIVIGSYAPSMIAPVAAASLASAITAGAMGATSYSIAVGVQQTPDIAAYILYAGLGALCAGFAIVLMRLVASAERLVRMLPIPAWLAPGVGGLLLACLAAVSPQTLSGGHGALHADLTAGPILSFLLFLILLKSTASIVSLGFGFRGGLFFASLFLGSLLGQVFARLVGMTDIGVQLPLANAALVGMGALAVAVVGGPLTMSFLVLETTRDFGLTAATIAAALVASTIVRERFGYSFSTWRLHLRGETIRSARDVGWIRSLTAGRMMRRDTPHIAATATVAEFRRNFPLGSTSRVIVLDDAQHYAGIIVTAKAYLSEENLEAPISTLATARDVTLSPAMNIEEVMRIFDQSETEELAVVDPDGTVLGLLAESFASRRYARELEKAHQELFGEGR